MPVISRKLIKLICVILFFCFYMSGCNEMPERQMENTMPENKLDHPDVLRIRFHPRPAPKTPTPAGARDIDIQVEQDVTIGCRLFTHDRTSPTILYFHGNGEIVSDYDAIGPMYQEVELNLLVTDFRGYGWSNGSPTATAMLRDAHTLYRELTAWLRDNGYSGPLFIMGRSLGSACAIELAAQYNDEIDGLIIESGFSETLPLARTLGLDLDKLGITEEETFNNLLKMESITKPTFILHGHQDQLIPPRQGEKLMVAGA
ncbi:MAG: alpha/beta fold hydrolase, partial [Desulfobulbaceae bacterium]|nr:alpha/beta fold hydrolase [Desulfobulbaceae bacterium]